MSRCVGEATVHVARSSAVAEEVAHAHGKRSTRKEDVAHHVEREAIVREDEVEEAAVDDQLEKVGDQVDKEDVHALGLPGLVRTQVVTVDGVLGNRAEERSSQDHELSRSSKLVVLRVAYAGPPLTHLAGKHDHDAHAILVEDEHFSCKGNEEQVHAEQRP